MENVNVNCLNYISVVINEISTVKAKEKTYCCLLLSHLM